MRVSSGLVLGSLSGLAALGSAACTASMQGSATWQVASSPPGSELRVAADSEPAQTLVVNATNARTLVGHFRAGERVRIAVVDAQWTNAPSAELYDAAGLRGQACKSGGSHVCIGGEAPLMGLVLLTVSTVDDGPMAAPEGSCRVRQRLYIPNGVEFAVPFDAEVELGPNDWEDGCYNNTGAIQVQVERASAKAATASERRKLSVDALAPRTAAGHFAAGEYLRVTVLGGGWNHAPGVALMDSAGSRTEKCGDPSHPCVGGDGQPLMGLMLLMSSCEAGQRVATRRTVVDRRYIPQGAEVVIEHDSDLFLAPNDWEDGLFDNSGSARVEIRTSSR
jgi:hypothetical protein